MNPALPLVLFYAGAICWAARSALIPHHTPQRAAASEPGDGASRSNARTGARTPLLGPTSQKTNCARRKLVECFCRVEKLASRLAHNQEAAGSNPAPATKFTRVPGHQTGNLVAWVDCIPNAGRRDSRRDGILLPGVAGLVATPRRVEAATSLPAWSLLGLNPRLFQGAL